MLGGAESLLLVAPPLPLTKEDSMAADDTSTHLVTLNNLQNSSIDVSVIGLVILVLE